MSNPFAHLAEPLDPVQPGKKFFNLNKLEDPRYGRYMAMIAIGISFAQWLGYVINYTSGEFEEGVAENSWMFLG